jgi:hypothetical protein
MFSRAKAQHRALLLTCATSALSVGAVFAAYAQDTTPTPAPSKTPDGEAVPVAAATAQATATATAPAETAVASTSLPTPYTQADLQLLSGIVQRPNGLTFYNDYIYAACSGDSTVYELDAISGATVTLIAGVGNAHTLIVEPSEVDGVEVMWVPEYSANTLLRLTSAGQRETIADGFNGPWGIVRESETSFIVSNLLGNSVVRATEDGELTLLLEGMAGPAGVVLDGDMLYVANNGSTRRSIEAYDLSAAGGETDSVALRRPIVTGLQNTTGLQLAPDGMLYFAYAIGTRGVVGRVDAEACMAAGGCTNDAVEIVLFTELTAPLAGLTISPDMRLYVHSIYGPELYWLRLGAQDSE